MGEAEAWGLGDAWEGAKCGANAVRISVFEALEPAEFREWCSCWLTEELTGGASNRSSKGEK